MKSKSFYQTVALCFLMAYSVSAQKIVIGYLPTYNGFPNSVNNVNLDVLTHLDIAFANPNSSGAISAPNGTATVVNAAHAKNVKVLLSIAGAGGDPGTYGTILSNATTTNTFVANLVQLTVANNLDGIDVDIEWNILNGGNVNAAQYEAFVIKLRDGLHAKDKIITAALGTWFIQHVTNTAVQAFDLIGMMSYDAYGTWTGAGQHSPYSLAVSDFNAWKAKGVDPRKLIVGIPFYGYSWGANGNRALTFNQITASYPGAENQDYVNSGGDQVYYNGIATIKQKTRYAVDNAGGIMIWELTQDASGNKSLFKAMADEMGTTKVTPVPDNLAKGKTVTASSAETAEFAASKITDGSYTTRWSSLYNDAEWIYVNLTKEYVIDRVKITWEAASAKNYQVQVSSNGQNWTTIKTITGNNTLTNDLTGLTGTGQYVRVLGSARNTAFGYSIFEIEVYGKEQSRPYSGTPIPIPGIVEAENYDLGGEGVAYHDLTTGNTPNKYRTDDVDIEACTDASGGFNIGYAQAGEWTVYTVDVDATGKYDFDIRVASTTANNTFYIEMDGVKVTNGNVSVLNTGGWQTWGSATAKGISLSSGVHRMKLVLNGEFNVNLLNVTSAISGFGDVRNSSISIYPNPSSSNLYYEIENTGQHVVKVYDMMGNTLIEEQRNTAHGVNVSSLQKGVYVFEMEMNGKKFINRFVVD